MDWIDPVQKLIGLLAGWLGPARPKPARLTPIGAIIISKNTTIAHLLPRKDEMHHQHLVSFKLQVSSTYTCWTRYWIKQVSPILASCQFLRKSFALSMIVWVEWAWLFHNFAFQRFQEIIMRRQYLSSSRAWKLFETHSWKVVPWKHSHLHSNNS